MSETWYYEHFLCLFASSRLSGVQSGVLPLSARGRNLPSSWTHHFTPHTCAPTSLHTTHLCTYSSLSAVPNVWTIYAPQPHPSAGRDYFYQHSHVACLVFHCVCNLTDYIRFRFRALGTPALRCRLGVSLIIVLFLPVGF